jgi:hypothetical protein
VRAGDVLTILDDEGPCVRVRILQEALRPVPKGREPEFFERLAREDGAP